MTERQRRRQTVEDRLLDSVEIAERLGKSRVTAWKLMRSGIWPTVDITPPAPTDPPDAPDQGSDRPAVKRRTQLRVWESDLDAWIAERSVPSAS